MIEYNKKGLIFICAIFTLEIIIAVLIKVTTHGQCPLFKSCLLG